MLFVASLCCTNGLEEVKRLFRVFAAGVIPEMNSWDDATEDIKKSVEKQMLEKEKSKMRIDELTKCGESGSV